MDANKAAYWIALGVLALGLISEYQHERFVALHRVADRAGAELCRISTRAEEAALLATGVPTRRAILPSVLAVADAGEMAREQAELVRERVRNEMLARREVVRARAEMQRAEIEQLRWGMGSDLRFAAASSRRVAVLCPKAGTRIVVNEGTDVSPDVEVEDNF